MQFDKEVELAFGPQEIPFSTKFANVLKNLPNFWFGVRLDAEKIRADATFLLSHPDTANLVVMAENDASKVDYAGLAGLAVFLDVALPRTDSYQNICESLFKAGSADLPRAEIAAVHDFGRHESLFGHSLSRGTWVGSHIIWSKSATY